jgi:hypothetical protein
MDRFLLPLNLLSYVFRRDHVVSKSSCNLFQASLSRLREIEVCYEKGAECLSYKDIIVVFTDCREGTRRSFGNIDIEDEMKRGCKTVDLISRV